jgi:hypothetical protein
MSGEAAGNAAASLGRAFASQSATAAASLGRAFASQSTSLAREVPGTVALCTGIAGFTGYLYLTYNKRTANNRQRRIATPNSVSSPLAQKSPAEQLRRLVESETEDEEGEEGFLMVPDDNDIRSVDSSEADSANSSATRAEAVFDHVLRRNTDAVIAALDEGVIEVDAHDGYGNTLLVLAAQTNCAALAVELLERGANINAQNWRGQTALHFAMSFGVDWAGMTDLLLARGADPSIKNDWGMTPQEGIMDFAGGGELMSAHPDLLPHHSHNIRTQVFSFLRVCVSVCRCFKSVCECTCVCLHASAGAANQWHE